MSIAIAPSLTPADLLAQPYDGRIYELVHGELKELPTSGESSWVAGRILRRVGAVIEDRNLGWVFPVDAGFQCFDEDGDMVRKPDVAFVQRTRLAALPQEGFVTVPPDLAVEVVSPRDRAYEVEAKVGLWLDAGCREVWVVMPRSRTVTVHRRDTRPVVLEADQTIESPTLLPGFSSTVGDFFPPPHE